MQHDRIIPGNEYDLLMNYKEIADLYIDRNFIVFYRYLISSQQIYDL